MGTKIMNRFWTFALILCLPAFTSCAGARRKKELADLRARRSGISERARNVEQDMSAPGKKEETPATKESEKESDPPEETNANVKVLKKDKAGCQWVDSKASVTFGENDTRHQAKARAVAMARSDAMQSFLGVTLRHEFIDFQQEGLKGQVSLTQNLLRTTQHGRVLKEKILSHGPKDLPDCPGCLYTAHIQTCIIPMKDNSDKGFRVEITLNRSRFVDGDEAVIKVTSTREAYIYLYNVDMSWNATLMFPNVYAEDNKVAAGKPFTYPPEDMKRAVGAKVVAALPENTEVSAELLRVIASKTPLPDRVLTGGGKQKKQHEVVETTGGGTFLDLMRRLSASDAEWVDDNVAFTIYKD